MPETTGSGAEFDVFARYLGASSGLERGRAYYAASQQSAELAAADRFDRWLVVVARWSPVTCALADAYARLTRPYGLLRRKLVLTLAVLESSPGIHSAFDSALASSPTMTWLSLVFAGTGWAMRTLAATLLLAPVHLVAAAMPDGARDV